MGIIYNIFKNIKLIVFPFFFRYTFPTYLFPNGKCGVDRLTFCVLTTNLSAKIIFVDAWKSIYQTISTAVCGVQIIFTTGYKYWVGQLELSISFVFLFVYWLTLAWCRGGDSVWIEIVLTDPKPVRCLKIPNTQSSQLCFYLFLLIFVLISG